MLAKLISLLGSSTGGAPKTAHAQKRDDFEQVPGSDPDPALVLKVAAVALS